MTETHPATGRRSTAGRGGASAGAGTPGDQRPDRAEAGTWPVRDRSLIKPVLGVPPLAAVALAVGLTAVGVLVDLLRLGTVGTVFQFAYGAGCLLAVAWVRRRSIFLPTIQPPLLLAVVVPLLAVLVGAPSPTAGATEHLLLAGAPLINAFPAMAVTTVLVLLVTGFRLVRQRTGPDDAVGRLRRRLSGRADESSGADGADDARSSRPRAGRERPDHPDGARSARETAGRSRLERDASARRRPGRDDRDRTPAGTDRDARSSGSRATSAERAGRSSRTDRRTDNAAGPVKGSDRAVKDSDRAVKDSDRAVKGFDRPVKGSDRPREGSDRPGEGSARAAKGSDRPGEGSARARPGDRPASPRDGAERRADATKRSRTDPPDASERRTGRAASDRDQDRATGRDRGTRPERPASGRSADPPGDGPRSRRPRRDAS